MGRWAVVLVVIAGCEAAPLGHRGDVGTADAARAMDGGLAVDAFSPEPDAATAPDAATVADAFVARDAPSCTPTRTDCNPGGLECGMLSNGCGATVDCGVCGDGIDTCEILASTFQNRVYNCVQMVQSANDAWFDGAMFRDTSSWLVLDAHAAEYVAAVAACVDAGSGTAIVDAGAPGNEIRVRPDAGGGAENFIVRTYSTGRTAARYTSTCSPAMF